MNIQVRIKEIRTEFDSEFSACLSLEDFNNLQRKYLSRKGIVASLFKEIPKLSADEKRSAGKHLNVLRKSVEEKISEAIQSFQKKEKIDLSMDVSLPGTPEIYGNKHILSQVMDEINSIFNEIGFSVETGPEVETDFNNFSSLNFPENHPARDMQDTFFITKDVLLRTHTSSVQIRVMMDKEPPLRFISPGRVYRNEAINARSHCMFHQVEGLYVDKNVTFAELKGTVEYFCKRFFGKDVALRFRPSFFPFTEPSAEVDISCFLCGGSGCRVCKHTGWLEILGCGMVDPNVFKSVGFDPEKITGFAFGMGVERPAMLKYGITDIRMFWENDIRFLHQF